MASAEINPRVETVPFTDFKEAADQTLKFLEQRFGLRLWMVTRTVGNRWIVLQARDTFYGVSEGDVFRWSDSLCYRMVQGVGPHLAPHLDEVEAYVDAPLRNIFQIDSYVGLPLIQNDGTLFGTLCAIAPEHQPEQLQEEKPLLDLLSRFLSSTLANELDMSKISHLVRHLEQEAYLDHLTEALNRRGWECLLEKVEQKCDALAEPVAVGMMDLDNLKQINDREGHKQGDEYVRNAAKALSKGVGEHGAVARLGGDEFGVLIEGNIATAPSSFFTQVKQVLRSGGVEASVGWMTRDSQSDLYAAIKEADKKMYEEKRNKKGSRKPVDAG